MNLRDVFRHNQSFAMIISYISVILMMTCLGISLASLVVFFIPDAMMFLPVGGFLIAFESMFSYRFVRQFSADIRERVVYRFSEIILLLLVLKLFVEMRHGIAHFLSNFLQWQEDFLVSFLTPEYLIVVGIMSLVWWLSRWYADDLNEMECDDFILSSASLEALPSNRRGVHQLIIGRILVIGLVMILVTAVAQYLLVSWPEKSLTSAPNFINVIVYFVFGLLLLSQTNFSALRAVWAYDRAIIDRNLSLRWLFYSVGFLIFLTLFALLLPVRYTLSFLPTLSYLLNSLIEFLNFLISLFLLPFFLLFGFFSWLLGVETEFEQSVTASPLALPEQIVSGPVPWWELVKSVVFWFVFILIVILAISQYIRQNGRVSSFLRYIFRREWIVSAWQWLCRIFGSFRRGVSVVIQAGIHRLSSVQAKPALKRWQFINHRNLSARQRIMFYYLALVRRSGDAGVTRRSSQTPSEYYRSLSSVYPELDSELASMTDAFGEARYSRHSIPDEKASLVRSLWQRLRHSLCRKK